MWRYLHVSVMLCEALIAGAFHLQHRDVIISFNWPRLDTHGWFWSGRANKHVAKIVRGEMKGLANFLGRLQQAKVRIISRKHILESAVKVFELHGSSLSILEVEYFGEIGTGDQVYGQPLNFINRGWQCSKLGSQRWSSSSVALFPRISSEPLTVDSIYYDHYSQLITPKCHPFLFLLNCCSKHCLARTERTLGNHANRTGPSSIELKWQRGTRW